MDAGTCLEGEGAAISVLKDERAEPPLVVALMMDVAPCLEFGETMCCCRPGGLMDPAGGLGRGCESGLRGVLYEDDARGDV